MKLAVVGATGLVGQEVLKVIDERNIEFEIVEQSRRKAHCSDRTD